MLEWIIPMCSLPLGYGIAHITSQEMRWGKKALFASSMLFAALPLLFRMSLLTISIAICGVAAMVLFKRLRITLQYVLIAGSGLGSSGLPTHHITLIAWGMVFGSHAYASKKPYQLAIAGAALLCTAVLGLL